MKTCVDVMSPEYGHYGFATPNRVEFIPKEDDSEMLIVEERKPGEYVTMAHIRPGDKVIMTFASNEKRPGGESINFVNTEDRR